MKTIANIILWIVWNVASILAFPIYALKHELKAVVRCFKEWAGARKQLHGYLMPNRSKTEPKEETEAVN